MRAALLLFLATGCLEIGEPVLYPAEEEGPPPPPEIGLVWTAPGEGATLPPRDPVVFVFDRELKPESARVAVTAGGAAGPEVNATYYRGMLELLPRGGFAPDTEHELVLQAVEGADGSALAEPITVSFRTSASPGDPPGFAQIQAIFSGACALSGCHVGPRAPRGADYSPEVSYANTVGAPSGCGTASCTFSCLGTCTEGEAMSRVEAGRPCHSCLMFWLRNGGMPVGPRLPAGAVDRVERWILAGAPQ